MSSKATNKTSRVAASAGARSSSPPPPPPAAPARTATHLIISKFAVHRLPDLSATLALIANASQYEASQKKASGKKRPRSSSSSSSSAGPPPPPPPPPPAIKKRPSAYVLENNALRRRGRSFKPLRRLRPQFFAASFASLVLARSISAKKRRKLMGESERTGEKVYSYKPLCRRTRRRVALSRNSAADGDGDVGGASPSPSSPYLSSHKWHAKRFLLLRSSSFVPRLSSSSFSPSRWPFARFKAVPLCHSQRGSRWAASYLLGRRPKGSTTSAPVLVQDLSYYCPALAGRFPLLAGGMSLDELRQAMSAMVGLYASSEIGEYLRANDDDDDSAPSFTSSSSYSEKTASFRNVVLHKPHEYPRCCLGPVDVHISKGHAFFILHPSLMPSVEVALKAFVTRKRDRAARRQAAAKKLLAPRAVIRLHYLDTSRDDKQRNSGTSSLPKPFLKLSRIGIETTPPKPHTSSSSSVALASSLPAYLLRLLPPGSAASLLVVSPPACVRPPSGSASYDSVDVLSPSRACGSLLLQALNNADTPVIGIREAEAIKARHHVEGKKGGGKRGAMGRVFPNDFPDSDVGREYWSKRGGGSGSNSSSNNISPWTSIRAASEHKSAKGGRCQTAVARSLRRTSLYNQRFVKAVDFDKLFPDAEKPARLAVVRGWEVGKIFVKLLRESGHTPIKTTSEKANKMKRSATPSASSASASSPRPSTLIMKNIVPLSKTEKSAFLAKCSLVESSLVHPTLLKVRITMDDKGIPKVGDALYQMSHLNTPPTTSPQSVPSEKSSPLGYATSGHFDAVAGLGVGGGFVSAQRFVASLGRLKGIKVVRGKEIQLRVWVASAEGTVWRRATVQLVL